MTGLPSPPILLITDRSLSRRPLADVLAAACAGGIRWISLREKDLSAPDRAALVRDLLPVVRRFGAVLTVHGDPGAARLCDGIHLPGGGDVAEARALLGPGALVGLSCHGDDDVARAAALGADYATVSPIFPTSSKPGYGPALGPDALRASARHGVPILALGGVDAGNARICRMAGAAGLAVMGGIMAADDPESAARVLIAAWQG